jgi:peptide/nickel transport system substrate-binding protein
MYIALAGVAIIAVATVAYMLWPKPQQERVLVILASNEWVDIDPSMSYQNEQELLANVYDTLVRFNPPGSAQKLSPALATSWNSSPDGLTWTFYLRQNVKFHDGIVFNATAVKLSIERGINMQAGPSYIWDPIQNITIIDAYTIQFKLSYQVPFPEITSSLYGAWIISPNATNQDDVWFNAGHEAGTGPYMIDSYSRGEVTVLKKFADYWGGWSGWHFDTVMFKVVRDGATREQMLLAGDGQIGGIPNERLAALSNNTALVISRDPGYINLLVYLNTQRAPLNNTLVRQAMAYAFPYQDVVDKIYLGTATQARGAIPAGMWGHANDLYQYNFNLTKARELLAQAGYPNGGFKVVATYTEGNTAWKSLYELYKAKLEEIGIDMEIRAMTASAKYAMARGKGITGWDPTQAQDITMLMWWPTYVTPYDFLFNLFHTESKPVYNFAYWYNSTFDQLIDSGYEVESTNATKALDNYHMAQEILINDCPVIIPVDQQHIQVMRKEIKGFVYNPAYENTVFIYDLYMQGS